MCKVKIDAPNVLYVNPMTDFGFKKIFGDEKVMTAFLTDLLKPKSPIAKITFIDKEMQPDNDLSCHASTKQRMSVVKIWNTGHTY